MEGTWVVLIESKSEIYWPKAIPQNSTEGANTVAAKSPCEGWSNTKPEEADGPIENV